MNQLTIQSDHGAVIEVPLNKLKASPRNARRTPHAAADIEALAASIATKGVIQPLVVEPEQDAEGAATGCYLVTIGEGRRQALRLRAKRRQITKSALVRCIVDTANDAFEISLDENVTRFAMHPADQFDAFWKLSTEHGFGPEEIAARFGVTPTIVRQRLRLATVSPALIAIYRAGEMTLDQLMAFTITADHARQEAAWDSLAWNNDPYSIRRCLTLDRVRATDRRAIFVGAETYTAAGGVIEHDLFSEDYGGYFADSGLLERLALEALGREANAVSAEGWKWVSATLEAPATFQMGRVYPVVADLSTEDAQRHAALEAAYESQCAREADGDHDDPSLAAQIAINAVEQAALEQRRRRFRPEDIARAGAFVTLASDGTVRVERGYLRKEDVPASDRDSSEVDAAAEREPRAPRLSDALVADLTAHRTAALCDQLGQQPDVALAALLYAFTLQTFPQFGGTSCLEVRAGSVHLSQFAPGIRDTTAGAAIEARHQDWEKELPDQPDALWPFLLTMHAANRLRLLAHCVAMTVNAVKTRASTGEEPSSSDLLASALKLEMSDYWSPDRNNYLSRVSKPLILEAVREGVSEGAARRLEGLKKSEMAQAAEGILANTRWVPNVLKTDLRQPSGQ